MKRLLLKQPHTTQQRLTHNTLTTYIQHSNHLHQIVVNVDRSAFRFQNPSQSLTAKQCIKVSSQESALAVFVTDNGQLLARFVLLHCEFLQRSTTKHVLENVRCVNHDESKFLVLGHGYYGSFALFVWFKNE